MNQYLRQHHRRRQIAAWGTNRVGNRGDRRPVAAFRFRAIEPDRKLRTAGEHQLVSGRMVGIGVRQRAHERPLFAPRGQARQMLANLHARRARGNRFELAANPVGRIGLHVEAFVLRQPARQKDVDHRFGRGIGPNGSQASARPARAVQQRDSSPDSTDQPRPPERPRARENRTCPGTSDCRGTIVTTHLPIGDARGAKTQSQVSYLARLVATKRRQTALFTTLDIALNRARLEAAESGACCGPVAGRSLARGPACGTAATTAHGPVWAASRAAVAANSSTAARASASGGCTVAANRAQAALHLALGQNRAQHPWRDRAAYNRHDQAHEQRNLRCTIHRRLHPIRQMPARLGQIPIAGPLVPVVEASPSVLNRVIQISKIESVVECRHQNYPVGRFAKVRGSAIAKACVSGTSITFPRNCPASDSLTAADGQRASIARFYQLNCAPPEPACQVWTALTCTS